MPFKLLPKPTTPTTPVPTETAKPEEQGMIRKIVNQGPRAILPIVGSAGGPWGAVASGGGEIISELMESGGDITKLRPWTIAAQTGLGLIPGSALLKQGKAGASFLRGALASGVAMEGRRLDEGKSLLPESASDAASMAIEPAIGGTLGAGVSKLKLPSWLRRTPAAAAEQVPPPKPTKAPIREGDFGNTVWPVPASTTPKPTRGAPADVVSGAAEEARKTALAVGRKLDKVIKTNVKQSLGQGVADTRPSVFTKPPVVDPDEAVDLSIRTALPDNEVSEATQRALTTPANKRIMGTQLRMERSGTKAAQKAEEAADLANLRDTKGGTTARQIDEVTWKTRQRELAAEEIARKKADLKPGDPTVVERTSVKDGPNSTTATTVYRKEPPPKTSNPNGILSAGKSGWAAGLSDQDESTINDLLKEAAEGGFEGNADEIASDLASRLGRYSSGAESATQAGATGEALLNAIRKYGGISSRREGNGGLKGELAWLKEFFAPVGRNIPSHLNQSASGVFNENGLSVDKMYEALKQEPGVFSNINDLNDLLAQIQKAATTKPTRVPKDQLLDELGEGWWKRYEPGYRSPSELANEADAATAADDAIRLGADTAAEAEAAELAASKLGNTSPAVTGSKVTTPSTPRQSFLGKVRGHVAKVKGNTAVAPKASAATPWTIDKLSGPEEAAQIRNDIAILRKSGRPADTAAADQLERSLAKAEARLGQSPTAAPKGKLTPGEKVEGTNRFEDPQEQELAEAYGKAKDARKAGGPDAGKRDHPLYVAERDAGKALSAYRASRGAAPQTVENKLGKLLDDIHGEDAPLPKINPEGHGILPAEPPSGLAGAIADDPLAVDDRARNLMANVSPKAQAKIQAILAKLGGDESGAVDPRLAMRLGGAGVGAATGAALDDEKPEEGAFLGGVAGFAGGNALASRLGPKVAGQIASNVGNGVTLRDITQRIPNYYRGSLLSHPIRLIHNSALGPMGAGFFGGLEQWAGAGNPKGKQIMAESANVPKWLYNFFTKHYRDAAEQAINESERGDLVRLNPTNNPILKALDKAMAWPAQFLTAGDMQARDILQRGGISDDAARIITSTNEPGRIFPTIKNLANFGKTRGKGGSLPLIANLSLPFRRTMLNLTESAAERIPGVGELTHRFKVREGLPTDTKRMRIAQQSIGGAVFSAAAAIGYSTDPDTEKLLQMHLLVSNLGGQYAGVADLGYAAGLAARKGKKLVPSIVDFAQSAARGVPMPSMNSVTDFVVKPLRTLDKLSEGKPLKKSDIPRGVIPEALPWAVEMADRLNGTYKDK
jgi:hypothetical protein